jgi:hypothetical protein
MPAAATFGNSREVEQSVRGFGTEKIIIKNFFWQSAAALRMLDQFT